MPILAKKTIKLGTVGLLPDYQILQADPSLYGSIGAGGGDEVILHFVGAGAALSDCVFRPEELFSYIDDAVSPNTEQIDWTPLPQDDGTAIQAVERALGSARTYQWVTIADRARVKVKGTNPTISIPYNTKVGSFTPGETVTTNTGATFVIVSDSGTALLVNTVNEGSGALVGSTTMTGGSSGATAHIISITGTESITVYMTFGLAEA